MITKCREFYIFAIVLVVVFNYASGGEENVGTIEQPLPRASDVHIINQTQNNLDFYVWLDDGKWTRLSLGSGKDREISCPRCSAGYIHFKMITGSGADARTAKYKLKFAQRYGLRWSGDRNRWDVVHLD